MIDMLGQIDYPSKICTCLLDTQFGFLSSYGRGFKLDNRKMNCYNELMTQKKERTCGSLECDVCPKLQSIAVQIGGI